MAFHLEQVRHRNLLAKAGKRIRNLNLATAWDKWMELIEEKREKEAKTNKWVWQLGVVVDSGAGVEGPVARGARARKLSSVFRKILVSN